MYLSTTFPKIMASKSHLKLPKLLWWPNPNSSPKKYTCLDGETRVHPTKIHQLVCFPSFIISGVNLRAFGNPKKAQTVWLRHLQPTYALPWMNWELSLLWGVKTNQLSGICGLGKLWFPKFLAHVFDVNGILTNQQKIKFSEGYLE